MVITKHEEHFGINSFHSNNQLLAISCWDSNVRLFDIETWNNLLTTRGVSESIALKDNTMLYADHDFLIQQDVRSKREYSRILENEKGERVHNLNFDDFYLLSHSSNSLFLNVWDRRMESKIYSIQHDHPLHSFYFDSALIITGTRGGEMKFERKEEGKEEEWREREGC
eukprot:CAMPEP_0174266008 /NCGR_PEP_ID=MMETSP0439-20130205/28635_1 /TAXON_ID=0 /ORGANISM="Stereomyxa ramosa, Strain Chinc5" /LENGTH=168 /DNA_ID=CAMNT_0015352731 /DNA_START=637 /DNA_END=1144 /DNA_ORIENTATION=-